MEPGCHNVQFLGHEPWVPRRQRIWRGLAASANKTFFLTGWTCITPGTPVDANMQDQGCQYLRCHAPLGVRRLGDPLPRSYLKYTK